MPPTRRAASFGDDRVFIEKFIEEPRHIEIQVLGDAHGNVVHLWRARVLDPAPPPEGDRGGAVAVPRRGDARGDGRAGGRAGQGGRTTSRPAPSSSSSTADRNFYFLEMNTRLQVEHPVTEMVTGLDLVELMIRVAAGEKLPFTQEDVQLRRLGDRGRIYAEDPFRNFLPSIGRLVRYSPPRESDGAVRVDTGVYEGGEISMHYDPMIAKLITHGADRDERHRRDARRARRVRASAASRHNIAFQAALMRHPRFVAGRLPHRLHRRGVPGRLPRRRRRPRRPGAPDRRRGGRAPRATCDRAAGIDRARCPGHELRIGDDYVVRR